MNVYSLIWNLYCYQKQNAGSLKELIEIYELIAYNKTNFPTRLSSSEILIIDLAFSDPRLGSICTWEIPEEYSYLSDHEHILM